MFKKLHEPTEDMVRIEIDGTAVEIPAEDTVAAAVLAFGLGNVRTTPVSGKPRAPYCLMGVCFDCLMEIDGVPNRQACMITVRDGMSVRRQFGVRKAIP